MSGLNVETNPIGMIRSSGVLAVASRFHQLPNNAPQDMPTNTGRTFIGIIPLLVTILRTSAVFFVLLLSSATEYGIFYFFAIPRHQATEPLFFDYLQSARQPSSLCNHPTEESATTCSRPTEHTIDSPWAVVDLFAKHTHWEHFSKEVIPAPLFRHRRLREAAPYYIEVALDLPESPLNIGIGMFSVQVELQSSNSTLIATSLRATRLPHETKWVGTARKFLLLIPLAIGAIHETRRVVVPSFRNFVESKDLPLEFVTVRLITSTKAIAERDPLEVIGGEIRIGKEFNDFQNLLRDWFFTCYAVGVMLLMVGQLLLFFIIRYLLRLRRERRDTMPDAPSFEWNEEVGGDASVEWENLNSNAPPGQTSDVADDADSPSFDWNENEHFDGDASGEWESLNSNVPPDQTSDVTNDASTEDYTSPPLDSSFGVAEDPITLPNPNPNPTTLPAHDSDVSDFQPQQRHHQSCSPSSEASFSRPQNYDDMLTDTRPTNDRAVAPVDVEGSTTMFPQLDDAAIAQTNNKREILDRTAPDLSSSSQPVSPPGTSPSKITKPNKSKPRSVGAA